MTDSNEDIAANSAALCEARLTGRALDCLPVKNSPTSVECAYVMQKQLHERLSDAGFGQVTGHKIGCTTTVMQEYLRIDSPCAGKVFDRTVHHQHGRYSSDNLCQPGVECEIAVRLNADLVFEDGLGSNTMALRQHAASTVGTAMASIELVDSRWIDFTHQSTSALIADDFFAAGCVLGEEITLDPLILDTLTGSMSINDSCVGKGQGKDILAHPLDALVWLARLRQNQGQPLRQSEFVTLGSLVQTQWLSPGDRVDITISTLGTASLQLT